MNSSDNDNSPSTSPSRSGVEQSNKIKIKKCFDVKKDNISSPKDKELFNFLEEYHSNSNLNSINSNNSSFET